MSIRYTRNLFLRAICVVYLFAFISFYVQIPGLYGDNGILPASSLLENSKHQTMSAKVHYQPTLLWLTPYIGLDTNYALDVLALLGTFLAFTGFVSQKFCTIPLFAGLWSLYFSLFQVGQVFMSTESDLLLLEVGFLSILIAPLLPKKRHSSKEAIFDSIGFWLAKWLLFRYLVSTGLSKFLGNDPRWWNLTALEDYYETMVLPTPLSWYSYHLPKWVLKLGLAYGLVCEMVFPLLFFVPFRVVRITGFFFQMFIQICTVLTGNVNLVNVLLVTLTFSLLDDMFFYGKQRKKGNTNNNNNSSWLGVFVNVILHGIVFYGIYHFLSLKLVGTKIDANVAFTKTEFNTIVKHGLNITKYVAFLSLAAVIVKVLYTALKDSTSTISKLTSVVIIALYSACALVLFYSSTVPLDTLHPATNSTIQMPRSMWYNRLNKLHIVNQYGVWNRLGGTERKEIILEGSDDLEGPWREYNFLYKPGNVNHSLPFVAPYTPRLDWQMWSAAQSTYQKEPWLLSMTHRLLSGRYEILTLLDFTHSPFVHKPPKYVRASLYTYKYTAWGQRSTPTWWTRARLGEYFPAFARDSPTLVDYLAARNLLPAKAKIPVAALWKQVLDGIRYVTSHLEATLLLWSVFTAGCAIITTTTKSK